MSDIQNGLILMVFGMGGVFVVLILFYFFIRFLAKAFPEKKETQEDI